MSFADELADGAPEMVHLLLGLVKRIYRKDAVLAEQLLGASRLIARRLDDARWQRGDLRERMLDEAAAAIAEAHTALYLGESFGIVTAEDTERAQRRLNHALAMLGAREHALLPPTHDTH